MRFFSLYILLICFLLSCRKEKIDPLVPGPPVEEPDFVLNEEDMNFPIGTTWAYHLEFQTVIYYLAVQSQHTYSSASDYLISVIRDSSMAGNLNGKILRNTVVGTNQTFDELHYVDPATGFYHRFLINTPGGNPSGPMGFSMKLPLTTSSKWENLYYPQASDVDSFKATGYENLALKDEILKCLVFKAGNRDITYWYNRKRGLAKSINVKYTVTNPSEAQTETTTITLIKFN